jgi:hypothetical protein
MKPTRFRQEGARKFSLTKLTSPFSPNPLCPLFLLQIIENSEGAWWVGGGGASIPPVYL